MTNQPSFAETRKGKQEETNRELTGVVWEDRQNTLNRGIFATNLFFSYGWNIIHNAITFVSILAAIAEAKTL